MPEIPLTQEAYDRLAEELADIENNQMVAVSKRILEARELGDLRENAEYHDAKDAQGLLAGRVAELKAILKDAVIISTPAAGTDSVDHGVKVTLRDEDGDEDVYVYTSTHNKVEGFPVISPESPLGTALHGARVGDSVTYEAPGGNFSVEVVAIEIY